MAGRSAPEYPKFKFSNGRTVRYRRVSPMLATEVLKSWRKKNPEPQPPVQAVKVLGVERLEPNYSDRNFQLEVAKYQERAGEEVGLLTLKVMIKRGVVLDIDESEMRAEVSELRKAMSEVDPDLQLDEDDFYVYVSMILCETQDDMNALRDALLVRSQPTPGEVEANITTFRGDVRGERDILPRDEAIEAHE